MSSTDAGPTFPTEMIHRILSSVIAHYIDDLIMGPLSLPAQQAKEDYVNKVFMLHR